MQTNRDGPQTLSHPVTRATHNHRTARGPPAPQATLCPVGLPGPLALGSLTDAPPAAARPQPRPPTAPQAGGRQRVQSSVERSRVLLSPPTHRTGAQRAQDEATEVATNTWTDTQGCGPDGSEDTKASGEDTDPTRRDGDVCRVASQAGLGRGGGGPWGAAQSSGLAVPSRQKAAAPWGRRAGEWGA